jgi:hypothetical protein
VLRLAVGRTYFREWLTLKRFISHLQRPLEDYGKIGFFLSPGNFFPCGDITVNESLMPDPRPADFTTGFGRPERTMSTDEELILEFQRGSQEAFDELFERYREPIYGFFNAA